MAFSLLGSLMELLLLGSLMEPLLLDSWLVLEKKLAVVSVKLEISWLDFLMVS